MSLLRNMERVEPSDLYTMLTHHLPALRLNEIISSSNDKNKPWKLYICFLTVQNVSRSALNRGTPNRETGEPLCYTSTDRVPVSS